MAGRPDGILAEEVGVRESPAEPKMSELCEGGVEEDTPPGLEDRDGSLEYGVEGDVLLHLLSCFILTALSSLAEADVEGLSSTFILSTTQTQQ